MSLPLIYPLALTTTDAMSPAQFARFRAAWILHHCQKLREDGVTDRIAVFTARQEFEQEFQKNNFAARNAAAKRNRVTPKR